MSRSSAPIMVSSPLATIKASLKESNSSHRQHVQEYSQYLQSHSVRACHLTESVSVSINEARQINDSERVYHCTNSSPLPATVSGICHQTISPVRSLSGNNLLQNESTSKNLLESSTSDTNDKISVLFPKCRPKNEVSLNNIRSIKVKNTTYIRRTKLSPVYLESPSTLIHRVATYPCIYSSPLDENNRDNSPSNSIRNLGSHNSGPSATDMPRKQNSQPALENPFFKETYWEARLNATPASTVLNSPDLTEIEHKGNVFQKQHVKVGRSPVSHSEALFPMPLDNLTRGLALVADGDVLIFDDIAESWQNLRVTTDNNNEGSIQQIKYQLSSNHGTKETSSHSENKQREGKYIDNKNGTAAGIRHGSKEYALSPRRISQDSPEGKHQSQQLHFHRPFFCNTTAQFPQARPGFPLRVHAKAPDTSTLLINDVHHSNTDDTSDDEIGTLSNLTPSKNQQSSFDYLYEFSETRKVLEEFFKSTSNEEKPIEINSDVESPDIQYTSTYNPGGGSNACIKQKSVTPNHKPENEGNYDAGCFNLTKNKENDNVDFFLDSTSRSSGDIGERVNSNQKTHQILRYSPETTDYDSNCGDLDSLSEEYNILSPYSNCMRYYASMPILEDGLSSGHASETENNNHGSTGLSILMELKKIHDTQGAQESLNSSENLSIKSETPHKINEEGESATKTGSKNANINDKVFNNIDPDLDSLYSISVFHRSDMMELTPPPPAPAPHRKTNGSNCLNSQNSELTTLALKRSNSRHSPTETVRSTAAKDLPSPHIPSLDVEKGVMATTLVLHSTPPPEQIASTVWVPRQTESSNNSCNDSTDCYNKNPSVDEEDVDTDLETDRLLGHQRLDDQWFDDGGRYWERRPRSLLASSLSKFSPKVQETNKKTTSSILRQGFHSLLPMTTEKVPFDIAAKGNERLSNSSKTTSIPNLLETSVENISELNNYTADSPDGSTKSKKDSEKKAKKSKSKEVLIEGVLFRARYLGSTQLVCEGQPTKSTRMMQAEEAVSRIKALVPDGEGQPSTEVDLFISTEKIMVLNTDLKEIMMDHALRTISYIADIGDVVVLMARRRFVPTDIDDALKSNRTPKMICHVLESEEAQFIAQSIGQAFQVAYMEFLKANGIEDHRFVKEMDYQEVLNSQEIFGDELEIFAKKELQKEVVVPKAKGEILGVVIVESGWGSMLPTVVIANMMSTGAAARCGQLNIGDQLIAINGLSLVGLPLSTCQNFIKNSKNQTVVKFTVVPCAPVVEVKIKRPNTKYQLGFSVQNGVICSLLRGGIAERGGVRVGHRIIEINNQSVVAVPHEKIVNLLATSVGEILMKTMPTSMFRLLTGQENPIYI